MRLGEVSEWLKELVLKTSESARARGFESYLLRCFVRAFLSGRFCLFTKSDPINLFLGGNDHAAYDAPAWLEFLEYLR